MKTLFTFLVFTVFGFSATLADCPGEGKKVTPAELKHPGEVILVLKMKGLEFEKFIDAEGMILFNVKDSQGILQATGLSLEKLSEQFPEIHHSLAG